VFYWTQVRCIIIGRYSLASELQAYLDGGTDIETFQEMYQEGLFFRTMLDNAAFALARTDIDIASQHASLTNKELQERFFSRITAEYDTAVNLSSR
jgi:phosphoenolpyruvate carboxylase